MPTMIVVEFWHTLTLLTISFISSSILQMTGTFSTILKLHKSIYPHPCIIEIWKGEDAFNLLW